MTLRLSTTLATLLVMAGAGGAAWLGAEGAADFIERQADRDVTQALVRDGHDWAEVATDGLQVALTGTAPSEVERFRALTTASAVVDAARLSDRMSVASVEAMAAPDFTVELLRNDAGISLIGLVPATTDQDAILRDLRAGGTAVTDFLETADHPEPPGWSDALRLGLQAARAAPQSKISIAPGRVQVTAAAADRAQQARLQSDLRAAAPAGVMLDLDISAPRPVIAPFTLRFVIDDDGARFDTCAADSDDGRDRILAAAEAAGMGQGAECRLGLGAPSAEWSTAAAAAIGAVAQLGRGQVTLSDGDVALVVPAGVEQARLDQVAGLLDQALPPLFSLQTEQEQPPAETAPVVFQATLPPSGSLAMRGRIADVQMREAVDSFARSRFEVAQSGLRTDPNVPAGWTVRVIAGLEAMGTLHAGQVEVTPAIIKLTGVSGDPTASDRAAAILSERLGAGAQYQLAIVYDRLLDQALGLPDGEECVAALNIIMSESEIGFEPNRASIAGDPEPTMARFSDVMTDCGDFQIEAGGHTDSQGSERFNAELSRTRAQAIVGAMADAGIDVTNISARGYGESRPVATNQTEAGREVNRRIEFRLLSPQPVRDDGLPAPVVVSGVTGQIATPAGSAIPDGLALGPSLPPMQGPTRPAPSAAQMQGPQLPQARTGSGMVPMTVGVSEQARDPMAAPFGEDPDARMPVLDADPDTPRPFARPDSVADRAQDREATDE